MNHLNLILLALILLLSSCNGVPPEIEELEEETTEILTDQESEDSESDEEGAGDSEEGDELDEDGKDCFNFIYPLSYEMPDGSTISGDSEENLWAAIEEWFELNGQTDREIALVYPVQIAFEDRDEVFTVNNDEELERMYRDCEEDEHEHEDDERSCFKFIYPVSYELPDGTIVSVESLEEFSRVVREWFETHDEVDAIFKLIYPVRIVFDDRDEIVTVNNSEQMERIRRDCEDVEDDGGDDDKRYDCEELRANFGDPCRTDADTEGTVNRDCECVE